MTGFTSVAKLVGVSLRGGKNVTQVQAHVTAKDLELLSELIEAGKVRRRSTALFVCRDPRSDRLPGTRPRQGQGGRGSGLSHPRSSARSGSGSRVLLEDRGGPKRLEGQIEGERRLPEDLGGRQEGQRTVRKAARRARTAPRSRQRRPTDRR